MYPFVKHRISEKLISISTNHVLEGMLVLSGIIKNIKHKIRHSVVFFLYDFSIDSFEMCFNILCISIWSSENP